MKDMPMITVKEARKILGAESKELDDDQILVIINYLTALSIYTLENNYVKKSINDIG